MAYVYRLEGHHRADAMALIKRMFEDYGDGGAYNYRLASAVFDLSLIHI